ncbi:MAG: winged helix-turn-helix transcriptional regulator [Bacteroidota bacterium]|nr:winged helix-turn-helix transcriptional regulator [Bacteroidota bacterium]
MGIKEKFMNDMMENQFKNMSSEEKRQMMEAMMDKFFSSMTDDEKKDIMSGMMGKMMGNNPMMGMMSMMMGRKGKDSGKSSESSKMPWDMCCDMMSGIKETANTARFATSELRGLFDEWCQQIEKEMLDFIKEKGTIKVDEMAEKFGISEESVKYLLSRLANKNLIDYKV